VLSEPAAAGSRERLRRYGVRSRFVPPASGGTGRPRPRRSRRPGGCWCPACSRICLISATRRLSARWTSCSSSQLVIPEISRHTPCTRCCSGNGVLPEMFLGGGWRFPIGEPPFRPSARGRPSPRRWERERERSFGMFRVSNWSLWAILVTYPALSRNGYGLCHTGSNPFHPRYAVASGYICSSRTLAASAP
jgi:hypothetical protein